MSPYLKAIQNDNSIPIDDQAVALWLKDLDNPLRWVVRPIFQLFFAFLLHIVWFFKRLPLPQFSAHNLLQWMICWFCKYFVRNEANVLILRHFACESNILNFIINHSSKNVVPISLYPTTIEQMKTDSFVEHDQELFRIFAQLGNKEHLPASEKWAGWQSINNEDYQIKKRWTQFLDFESAHALFMCLFCLLLKKDEYRDAINGFNLDQSMAIRVGDIIGKPELVELAYNKYPHYILGPWNLSQRFLMHGFFCEYLYAALEENRKKEMAD